MTDSSSLRSQLDQLPRPLMIDSEATRIWPYGYALHKVRVTTEEDSQFLRDYFNALPASDKT